MNTQQRYGQNQAQPAPTDSTVGESTQTVNPADQTTRRFRWLNEIQINTDPRIKGQCMSLSDSEIIIDALQAYSQKAVEELEWLFNDHLEKEYGSNPEAMLETIQRDCVSALEVIKCCYLYTGLIASLSLADLRIVAAQYPDLADNRARG